MANSTQLKLKKTFIFFTIVFNYQIISLSLIINLMDPSYIGWTALSSQNKFCNAGFLNVSNKNTVELQRIYFTIKKLQSIHEILRTT